MTQGYSASDISNIANDASFGPLRDLGGIEKIRDVNKMDVRPIGIQDFYDSIKSSKRSVSKELLDRYTLWENSQASSWLVGNIVLSITYIGTIHISLYY